MKVKKAFNLAKRFLYAAGAIGTFAILALAALITVLYTGVITPEKLRTLVKYNPIITKTQSIVSNTSIETNFYTLARRDIALPAMGQGFKSGGGAIAQIAKGILIAEKSGRFFFLDSAENDQPRLQLTNIYIDINQQGFEREARALGYAVKPGTNVGYAGLGMRVHDLLLLENTSQIMASYTRWNDKRACAELIFSIARLKQNKDLPSIGKWQEIFKTTPCLKLGPQKNKPFAGHQAGGRMVEINNGKILVTVGDFKNDGDKRSITTADLNNSYGKTHLFDLNTRQFQKNYTIGHRNPQGLVLRQNGEIWLTEHGPTGGDEINQIFPDVDYGWPKVTLGKDCNGCDWQAEGRHDGFRKPRWAFLPSIGISNLIEVSNFAPLWDGDLLVSSLKGETLYRIRLDGNRPIYASPIPIGQRIRDITQLKNGTIVLWTDSGKLIYIKRTDVTAKADLLAAGLPESVKQIITDCKTCHVFNPGNIQQGQLSLWEIVGRRVGSQSNFTYSTALSSSRGNWTPSKLDKFLESPGTAMPGTSMAYSGIPDPTIRELLIEFLEKLQ